MAKIAPPPPVRCQVQKIPRSLLRCGKPAEYARVDPHSADLLVVCGSCATPADTRLREAFTIPTVTVTCEIRFAGVSRDSTTARQEAIATLELAVLGVGGQLSVSAVTSALSRYYPAAAARGAGSGPRQG